MAWIPNNFLLFLPLLKNSFLEPTPTVVFIRNKKTTLVVIYTSSLLACQGNECASYEGATKVPAGFEALLT
jgi:ribonuclease HIII